MKDIENLVRNKLLDLKDEKNKIFVAKLLPTINPDTILWIKTPIIKNLVKELIKQEKNTFLYLDILPHYYLEEYSVHTALIENIKDFNLTLKKTEDVLPYIDNRAVCDSFKPKVFKKYPKEIYEKAKQWIQSSRTYTIRYWVWIFLSNYLDEYYSPEMVSIVSKIKNEDYYVQMMQARFYSTALAKHPKETIELLKQKKLAPFIQNKAIQKAKESKRVDRKLVEELEKYKISQSK